MYYVVLAIHLLIALLLGVVVLLQRSKGGGLAGAFGGVGAGEAMFGSRGVTTMLHKATIYLAIAFMVTSLGLVYLTAQRSENPASPGARSAGGRPVLPVGAGDVAAPDVPVTTAPADDVVPSQATDDIVPDAGEGSDEADEATGGGGTSGEGESESGGN